MPQHNTVQGRKGFEMTTMVKGMMVVIVLVVVALLIKVLFDYAIV